MGLDGPRDQVDDPTVHHGLPGGRSDALDRPRYRLRQGLQREPGLLRQPGPRPYCGLPRLKPRAELRQPHHQGNVPGCPLPRPRRADQLRRRAAVEEQGVAQRLRDLRLGLLPGPRPGQRVHHLREGLRLGQLPGRHLRQHHHHERDSGHHGPIADDNPAGSQHHHQQPPMPT
jgi:hypothetical protein